ncbi:transmembrane protein 256 homolog [Venturia canescens]|uniref:transmembrane protein 256 homolog n=1 Tax=Venturia canescens TaxID=32260 RepID=UPI001C9C785B|nr:transmembrane protein 256 homolog [Venturia canescens]
MGVQDVLSYVLFTNPISSTAGSYAKLAASSVVNYTGLTPKIEYKMIPPEPLWKIAARSGPWMRIAALSGAAAVILGAIGAHRKYPDDKGLEQKQVFDTANRYHFIHALAMMGLPFCRVPILAASFMVTGTFLFCGTCYYTAFTGDKRFSRFTPIGGTCLILGWLSMCI